MSIDICSPCSYNGDMIRVGVKDLKNQLSQYLQHVKNGEKVIITEHNRVIAEMNLPQKEKKLTSLEEKLKRMSKEGYIIPAKRKKSYAEIPEIKEKLDWKSIYNETRADRI